MDREKYIKYLAYQLINKLFWIIALLAIVCILTINVMWIHNIFLGLFSIAEVILVYVSQYFIRAIQHNQNINILGYKSNKISSQKYNVTVLNFKVIEFFVVLNIGLWMIIVVMSQHYLKLSSVIIINVSFMALASVFVILSFIVVLIYYSIKY
ncbi:hypothetical protein [Lactobacillus crispatus]|jgi:hypothetical protein|uniref:Uncharacterized protein n=1 Tax=Lactobacillus crispatus TaxID=47770 RepID=A0A135YWT0_9LACO|nr:hypothetical protein [Lactobacillus crispatus]STX16364.1 Uncharacterised protein [Lactobacillus acidophilus]EEJ69444.1 hypothetical protein HMPREF0506_1476 [Lactobacillus crispatus JV-V01]EEU19093.1 hypothetical protein HMPREF5045_01284 [Lactobacillus crispatus 125-2-CHN]EQM96598.1 hypothetical protein HMPREF0507_02386 [Lactobacillus crispatus MV-1A-US]KWU05769.1 hypothetical protein AEL96_06860 [Lactobacillus crispatus]